MSTGKPSEFYEMCRDGNVNKVRRMILHLGEEDLNQIEPNGSTALHVASFRSHVQVVELLIERGIHRGQRNRYGLTAYEEAQIDTVRKLLARSSNYQRFGGSMCIYLEDELDDETKSVPPLFVLPAVWGAVDKEKLTGRFLPWLKNISASPIENEVIKGYCRKLTNTHAFDDILCQLHSEETPFYTRVNEMLSSPEAREMVANKNSAYSNMMVGIAGLINSHSTSSDNLPDRLYRKVTISDAKLKSYTVGEKIYIPGFMSTTKNRNILSSISGNVTFIIDLREKYTAKRNGEPVSPIYYCRDISKLSAYPYEDEVLWWPWSTFRIKEHLPTTNNTIEVYLEPVISTLYLDLINGSIV